MEFRVNQIDHVELTVPDRFAAAKWYQATLGLEIVSEFQFWSGNPSGPLMIGTQNANTKLALFEGNPQKSKLDGGFHLLAFSVDGEQFLQFLSRLEALQLLDSKGRPVTRNSAVNHQRAFSIYFCDPWGHQLEITTYDHEVVRQQLDGS